MGPTAWRIGALGLSLAQLACQSPSATPASSKPPGPTGAQRAEQGTSATAPVAYSPSGNRADAHTALPAAALRPGDAPTLRLATWNMQWLAAVDGHGPIPRTSSHYAQLAQIAARLNADIVAVQEVESSQAIERVFDPRQYSAFMSDSQGAQDVGFVVRRGIHVQQLGDVVELNVGGVRPGADLLVTTHAIQLRLLSVHLKSGCFRGPLRRGKACSKLAAQVPALEAWIDARQREGVAFAVLGDFNREFYSSPQDEVWSQLNDADPEGLELWSPTSGRRSQCWNSRHPDFVDHLVFGPRLRHLASAASFHELMYDSTAQPTYLSDHCPLSIDLNLAVEHGPTAGAPTAPVSAPNTEPTASTRPQTTAVAPKPDASGSAGAIKGNIAGHGKKLYHLPHCPSYAATKIESAHGERWFQTEHEAQAAGWTKASNCP